MSNDRRQLAFHIGHIRLAVDRIPDCNCARYYGAGSQRDGRRMVGLMRCIIDWLIERMFRNDKDWDQ
jgi:hypothetical protein